MARTNKVPSDQDANQTLQGAYNEIDATFTVTVSFSRTGAAKFVYEACGSVVKFWLWAVSHVSPIQKYI